MGEEAKPGSVAAQTRRSLFDGGVAALRGLLGRPLASYYLLISSAGLLLLIGLTMVFSATGPRDIAADGDPFSAVTKQAIFAVIGVLAFWVCQRLPARTFRALARPVLGFAIALLLFLNGLNALAAVRDVKVVRLGPIQSDLLWLHIGSVQVQPSEFVKIGLILWAADVISRKGPALSYWRELAMPLFPVVALLFVLVGYNDLGTMLILLAIMVGMLWAAGVRMRVFAGLSAVGLVGIGGLIAAASRGGGSDGEDGGNYRFTRLLTWYNPPENCASNDCYQGIQARNAIDNGGWFGVGLGEGRLKWNWLPAADNDFIFAVIAEELGVIGCAVVLALFGVLAYTGLRIARRIDDPFRRLVAAALTTWLVAQALINIGGVVGLIPITGLPLPFISDGGSALVVTLAGVGMLASFARAEPDAARALHARPPARWVRLLWAPLPPLPQAPKASRPTAPAAGRAARDRAGVGGERRR
ncbi:putative peptidoglycan glycosyltransferase FtsW [Asanoa sp. WMMD1127]|uniref:FtsW/RodA/SpoVE family cell cycle protein n=1 Tax=Asanoa sp. WMMD1127 TaxID=3016107 RepID=UPI002417E62E|nr:putative peptidoglycan glycosyltransferase FtsW [Asanoa sp. WMMD1127]MDG4827075.1 putative peptidoglycan glycosyltransferase FtsW [Asanoa sp. WMMD1127]